MIQDLNIIMATLRLSSNGKNNIGKKYLYDDLHMDINYRTPVNNQMNQTSETNDLKLDYDIEAVRNSLYNLFNTSPGQKVLNPEFGLDLGVFLFDPITRDTANEIKRAISIGIRTFEPRVFLSRVDVIPSEDFSHYVINVIYDIPTLNISNISMFGNISNSGYVFRN